mmetsp:Transcript_22426/g.34694  ORF Transcript_22426/g.34694 Transcript_22426/m.34694 type:complete len:145 (+) Transcript_22426:3-437(+)
MNKLLESAVPPPEDFEEHSHEQISQEIPPTEEKAQSLSSSDEDEDEFEKGLVLQSKEKIQKELEAFDDENSILMPLVSPRYVSQRVAEKQRPPTPQQKQGASGLRKFKVPKSAKGHIDSALEQEDKILSRNGSRVGTSLDVAER